MAGGVDVAQEVFVEGLIYLGGVAGDLGWGEELEGEGWLLERQDDLAEALDVGAGVVVDEERDIRTHRAADVGQLIDGDFEVAHLMDEAHEGSGIGAAASQTCLSGDALSDDHFVVVKKLEDIEIAGVLVERCIGFVDGIGLQRNIVEPLEGKRVALARDERDRIVEVIDTHEAGGEGVVAVAVTGDFEEDIDFGGGVDLHEECSS